jgi:hypothetical protein
MGNVDESIKKKMLKPIGKRVHFQYPGDEGHKTGVLKDRVIVPSNPGETGVPYWDVVDLIEFSEEAEPLWMRIGYYRKPGEHLVWGSQTTITEPIKVWKRLLVQAANQKPWFKQLLTEVMWELQGGSETDS